jgi:hypothetical protein
MKRDEAIAIVKDGFEQLENALKAGRSDELIRYLSTMSKFHNYSFRNMIMIWMQKPDATMVAGFHAWKKLGRSVKKSEKGIAIFAPMPFKQKQDVTDTNKSESSDEESQMMGFKVVHVFDIVQTEGDPLPEPARVVGRIGANLARIQRVVTQSDIELVFEKIEDGAKGYSTGGKIAIEETLRDSEKFAVIAHELAHEHLHHGERRAQTTKTVRETEAEAASFIVCTAFGLDSATRSSDYILLYDGSSDTLKESLKYIQSTAGRIIESIHAVELDCDHSLSLQDEAGRPTGSWTLDSSTNPPKYHCSICHKFYGYVESKPTVV